MHISCEICPVGGSFPCAQSQHNKKCVFYIEPEKPEKKRPAGSGVVIKTNDSTMTNGNLPL
jgi:hypothetical protein